MQFSRIVAVGGSVGAFFGSCCALPLLMLFMTGSFGFAAQCVPYQKYFMIAALAMLAFAFYLVYGREKKICENSKICNPKSQKITKIILWISTALSLIFLVGPYVLLMF